MITNEQKYRYLYMDSSKCPVCTQTDFSVDPDFEIEGKQLFVNMSCNACGETWVDGYTLTNVYNEGEEWT